MLKIDYEMYSNIGSRDNNEDSITAIRTANGYVFAVADGLGGHARGKQASKCVCDCIENYFNDKPCFSREYIEDFYLQCQNQLCVAQEQYNGSDMMRTTLSMVCIDDNSIWISHIGDSRVYLYKDGANLWRTRDHSVSQILCDLGEIDEAEIRFHEDRNKLTRVLGIQDRTLKVDIEDSFARDECIKLIICSDGFWELINEDKMLEVLRNSPSAKDALDVMISIVEEAGKNVDMDNNSAIVIFA